MVRTGSRKSLAGCRDTLHHDVHRTTRAGQVLSRREKTVKELASATTRFQMTENRRASLPHWVTEILVGEIQKSD